MVHRTVVHTVIADREGRGRCRLWDWVRAGLEWLRKWGLLLWTGGGFDVGRTGERRWGSEPSAPVTGGGAGRAVAR